MTTASSIPQYMVGEYNDEIRIGVAHPSTAGRSLSRDSLNDSIHQNNNPVYHESYSHVVRNKNGCFFFSGDWEIKMEWEDGQLTESQIDDYIQLISPFRHPTVSCTKDMSANSLSINLHGANARLDDWGRYQPDWMLATAKASIISKSDGGQFYCIQVLNNRYNDYTIETKTIRAGASEMISKEGTEHCFLLFTGDVIKEETTLNKHQAYRITSPSVTVTNASSADDIRVVRLYR